MIYTVSIHHMNAPELESKVVKMFGSYKEASEYARSLNEEYSKDPQCRDMATVSWMEEGMVCE